MTVTDPGIEWLLASDHPAVRYRLLTEVLDLPDVDHEVQAASADIIRDEWIIALLADQQSDSSYDDRGLSDGRLYAKWWGGHWRLVSMIELGISASEPRALKTVDHVLNWLTGQEHRSRIQVIEGRTRRCASQEGNALAVAARLGLAADARVRLLAESLVSWQWPDGGWNCDKRPEANHSSFHESLIPLWGLIEYQRAAGDTAALESANRAAEFFLSHHIFRSHRSGEVIHPEMLGLHYPPYWHYDFLQALLVLSRLGPLVDARLSEALDLLESKRQRDGTWRATRHYWNKPGAAVYAEPVDWGRRGPNLMLTLNALRVLHSAGRLAAS